MLEREMLLFHEMCCTMHADIRNVSSSPLPDAERSAKRFNMFIVGDFPYSFRELSEVALLCTVGVYYVATRSHAHQTEQERLDFVRIGSKVIYDQAKGISNSNVSVDISNATLTYGVNVLTENDIDYLRDMVYYFIRDHQASVSVITR